MPVTRKLILIIIAIVVFGVGLLLTLIDEGSAKVFQACLFGGLAAFAAAFLP